MANVYRYYEILGLRPGVSADEIKQAYRRLVKEWHPDRFATASPEEQAAAESRIKEINEAYEYLKDNPVTPNTPPPPTAQAPANPVENEAQWYYIKGVEKAKQERYTDALADFSQAIFLQPDYILAYKYRGLVYAILGNDRKANADLRRVSELQKQGQGQPTRPRPSPFVQTPPPSGSGLPWHCAGTLRGHTEGITAIALSPDSRYLVSSSYDQTLRVWQLSTGRPLRVLTGHSGPVYSVAISPDGRWVASGGEDHTVRLWNLQNGRLIRTLGGWMGGHSLAVLTVVFHPDRKRLVTGGADQTLRFWQFDQGKELRCLTGYADGVTGVAISPDGLVLVSSSLEKSLKIRQMGSGRLVRSHRESYHILTLLFNSDGSRLFTGNSDHQIRAWDLEAGAVVQTYSGHQAPVSAIALSTNRRTLFSGSAKGVIKGWSVGSGREQFSIQEHQQQITGLAVTADGNTLASSSLDGTVKIWWRSGS